MIRAVGAPRNESGAGAVREVIEVLSDAAAVAAAAAAVVAAV